MKFIASFVLVLSAFYSLAQNTKESTIEAKLYLPAHLKSTLTPADKLAVYFTTFPDDSVKVPKKIIAKKIKENIYEFQMPTAKFWHIGFSIGNYSYQMVCVDNRNGDANENYYFNILLENKKADFTKSPSLLPPCMNTDDE